MKIEVSFCHLLHFITVKNSGKNNKRKEKRHEANKNGK